MIEFISRDPIAIPLTKIPNTNSPIRFLHIAFKSVNIKNDVLECYIKDDMIILVTKATFLKAIGIYSNPKGIQVVEPTTGEFQGFLTQIGFRRSTSPRSSRSHLFLTCGRSRCMWLWRDSLVSMEDQTPWVKTGSMWSIASSPEDPTLLAYIKPYVKTFGSLLYVGGQTRFLAWDSRGWIFKKSTQIDVISFLSHQILLRYIALLKLLNNIDFQIIPLLNQSSIYHNIC